MSDKKHYLRFKNKKCPHCGGDINIDIFYEVADRFEVDYEAVLEKGETGPYYQDDNNIAERLSDG